MLQTIVAAKQDRRHLIQPGRLHAAAGTADCLTLCAARLAPWLAQPRVCCCIDLLVALMLLIAAQLMLIPPGTV